MDFKSIFNLLLIIGVVHGVVFIGISFFIRKKVEKTILFLNLFILFISLNNLNAWLIDKGFLGDGPLATFMSVPWYVLIMPMFYSFLLNYLDIADKKWTYLRLSVVLFLSFLIVRLLIIDKIEDGRLHKSTISIYGTSEDIAAFLFSVFLYVKSFQILTKYQKLYADILSFDDLRWIKQFLRFGVFLFIFWLTAIVLNSFTNWSKAPYTYYPLRLTTSILIYWVGYTAFYRYVIMQERLSLRKSVKKKKSLNAQSFGFLRKQKAKKEFKKVNDYVLANKSHLNPLLGLESLASELKMGSSTLSKLINENFTGNFSDYINLFRVEEAKRILSDPEFENYTIVALCLECGFNSKSTFYKAFKQHTGLTPSEYKKVKSQKKNMS